MTKNELQLSPLRSLDDFLLGSARFQLPNYRDLEKWGNRVVQNLLYYQTNYFIMAIFIISVFTLIHPLKMLLGALSVIIMAGLFYYSLNSSSAAMEFKKKYPLFGVLFIVTGACLVVYLLGSFIVFLCGILSPISAIFIHASLRLRNIKNKLANIERVVSNKTPMGVLLESLGSCMYVLFFLLFMLSSARGNHNRPRNPATPNGRRPPHDQILRVTTVYTSFTFFITLYTPPLCLFFAPKAGPPPRRRRPE